jgi:solute carrier family 25 oxoglutarate transporter 11
MTVFSTKPHQQLVQPKFLPPFILATSPKKLPTSVNFATAGLGGLIGWVVIHPFNTLAIRMNLASTSGATVETSFFKFSSNILKTEGVGALYKGLGAGLLRQLFYATSRFGFFEVFRDTLAKYRETDFLSRLICGVVSGGVAAAISCPAEVTLVRLSNDAAQPVAERRNYKSVGDAFARILREEGPATFFRGVGPFVNRAMLVGAVQVGTYDQFRELYRSYGVTHETLNVFYAAMTSGLIYSVVTMPFETAKNRMAFQRPDPVTGINPYRSALQTITTIAKQEGTLRLWTGFPPYYLRCGGHTVFMFMSVEWLRGLYHKFA